MDGVLAEVEGRPFGEQLRALLERVFAHFVEHARFFTVVLQSEPPRGPSGTKANTLAELTSRFDVVIQRGVAQGVVRREGAEFHATLLLGMVRGLLWRAAEARREGELRRGADALLQVFLKGIEV